jgi:cytochrome b
MYGAAQNTGSDTMRQIDMSAGDVTVWDSFVRLFHWSLAAAFFIAYITEDEIIALHVWAGYAIGGLIVLRIVWGFIGTKHARFSDFLFGPFAAMRYLRGLLRFRATRHLGHSPAGGFMVYLLMAGCLAVVVTGLVTYGAEGQGPLKGYVKDQGTFYSFAMIDPARADEDERAERDERSGSVAGGLYEELHEVLANLVLALVLLHVGGVLLASLAHRENLVRSMLTGRKRSL